MIQKIRKSRFSKIIASYLALQMVISVVQPMLAYALTSGPSQPEFNSFTPIGTSDMVNLSTGDFNYNIPIMDVGGYPLNLAYDSGIAMDQEASWVGLGWNLNVGQITRTVRGIPDDFNGDSMIYENNVKDNVSIGVNGDFRAAFLGLDFIELGVGLGVQYNNYNGITWNYSFGPSFDISERVAVGLQLNGTSNGGVSVSPRISLTEKEDDDTNSYLNSLSGSLGLTYDSQKGLSQFNIAASNTKTLLKNKKSGPDAISYSTSLNDYLTFTPRNELSYTNANLSLSLAGGTEIFGVEGQGQVTAWGNIQYLENEEKNKSYPAFGYQNTENSIPDQSILDFNREKDRVITENTKALAPTNYTYDSYAISGQGLQGSFRPHRNQVGNVWNPYTSSIGLGGSIGVEAGAGNLIHFGVDVELNPSTSSSGAWNDGDNTVFNTLSLSSYSSNNQPDYEATYFKFSGDKSADSEYTATGNNYYEELPLKVGLSSGGAYKFNRKTRSHYNAKSYDIDNVPEYSNKPINSIKRDDREARATAITSISNLDAVDDILIKSRGSSVSGSHTAGIKVLKPDGNTYVFGETAYNNTKIEATFAVNGSGSHATGLIGYSPGSNNSLGNSAGRDHYFNRVTTPAYAHSYLLTSVLSSDYEDLTDDGLTPDDLGSYTKLTYQEAASNFKWRVPVAHNQASYNAGLYTDGIDQKGNYVYGEKEIKYIHKIETKTHVAEFFLSDREDALPVVDQNGQKSESADRMQKLDSIQLYTIAEYNLEDPIPLKVAHFNYDYSLAPGIPNHSSDISQGNGKLTLTSVHFTYQNSKMGAYTPYNFNYTTVNNFPYNIKGYDVWGTRKENDAESGWSVTGSNLSPTEYPFVEQNKEIADANATAWALASIELPSGGVIQIDQESDDYQYVQNRRAMQMFILSGAGDSSDPSPSELTNDRLYNGGDPSKYLYVQLPESIESGYSIPDFRRDFLSDTEGANGSIGTRNNALYFRVMTNMTNNLGSQDYDYVTGYVLIKTVENIVNSGGNQYAVIELVTQDKEGGIFGSGEQVNPISKAGWYFARRNLNRQSYGIPADPNLNSIGDVAEPLLSSIGSIVNIFGGPNEALKQRNIASRFVPEKSWIRMYEPTGTKLGGGARVSRITLFDNWDAMVNDEGNDLYSNQYGQDYEYLTEDGKSSGVATFEPNGSKENPFVLPIYDDPVKLVAPAESNYVEKPLGESFFPSAQVTYSRVKVKNLNKDLLDENGDVVKSLTQHATGSVLTEFYTSRDFPTKADFTDPSVFFDKTGIIGNFLKVRTRNHLAMSQGITVETNDMNGKMKSQTVSSEDQGEGEFLSRVDYYYATKDNGDLDSEVNVVFPDGLAGRVPLGVNYDMINDFRKSQSESIVAGVDGNAATIILPIPPFFPVIVIPAFFPNLRTHQTKLKLATTTKVIHRSGHLVETVAQDLGSRVTTSNLVWDAQNGQVLLTRVDNEYADNYYSFNYPANWYYDRMGYASENILFEGEIIGTHDFNHLIFSKYDGLVIETPSEYLKLGDELRIEGVPGRYWVVGLNVNISIMDVDGNIILLPPVRNKFKIVRSGNRNMVGASMASATTQGLPFTVSGEEYNNLVSDGTWVGLELVNASAVTYNDFWDSQCEYNFPEAARIYIDDDGNITEVDQYKKYNPYLYNVLGDFRADKSYAYLTGRNNGTLDYHPRNEGFFKDYSPFYKTSGPEDWQIDTENWTNASEVTKISPFGVEVENMDALGRFSAAQYDYSSTLPTAVASNAEYREIGFDGFELSPDNGLIPQNHFSFTERIENTSTASFNSTESHSGRTSVLINGGTALSYNINPNANCEQQSTCDGTKLITAVADCLDSPFIPIKPLVNDQLQDCTITNLTVNVFGSGNVTIYGFDGFLDPNDESEVAGVTIKYTGPLDANPLFEYTVCSDYSCDTENVFYNCDP